MPIARRGEHRGQAHEYDTAAVVAWILDRVERRVRADDPKSNLYRTQTRLNEIRIAEAEGGLVDRDQVERGFVRLVVAARVRLLQIPGVLAGALAASADAAECTQLLESAIIEALHELAAYTVNDAGETK